MAPNMDDACPICSATFISVSDGSAESKESHVNTCIEAHSSDGKPLVSSHLTSFTQPQGNEPDGKPLVPSHLASSTQPQGNEPSEEDTCAICHTSFLTQDFENNASARQAHFSTCFESQISNSKGPVHSSDPVPPPSYKRADTFADMATYEKEKGLPIRSARPDVDKKAGRVLVKNPTMPPQILREPSGLRGFFSSFGGDSKTKEQKTEAKVAKGDDAMRRRWGPLGNPTSDMVLRYWQATRMQQHWEFLRTQHPRQFKKYMEKGYMEPIPTTWVQDRRLAWPYPEPSTFENPAEKRLYYLLNKGVTPDGSTHPTLRPLNINRDMYTIIRRGNQRNARQVHLDAQKLAAYQSPGDVFQGDKQIKSHRYSDQVPNVVYAARTAALHELADGILHGTDHLETMILIDVSGSMTWNPHQGMVGPDGIRRFHDQPSNIRLVEHLVHRVLNHMIPRAQKEHPNQRGIETVTFSTYGEYIGQLPADQFKTVWRNQVSRRLGGGTQVMQGWQRVKNTYFLHQHQNYGHGRWDPHFGWQATPGMPKLSLLVFLDGEATDMDEFELELLGETWAYVTIALVGMENCPHHHSHAVELERVAKFNPHVGFFDVHGRVCERMVVEDLLSSVYPVDPPMYSEILKPEFDLPPEELPAYSAY